MENNFKGPRVPPSTLRTTNNHCVDIWNHCLVHPIRIRVLAFVLLSVPLYIIIYWLSIHLFLHILLFVASYIASIQILSISHI